MAISGGAGEYHMLGIGGEELSRESESKKEEDKLDRKEREDLFDWWREFGFRGRDGGMGRVLRSEPRKGHKKGKGGIKFLLISLAIQIVLIVLFVVICVHCDIYACKAECFDGINGNL